MIHTVAMQVGSVAAALAGDSLGKHLNDFVKRLPFEIAVRIGAADRMEQSVFRPVFRGAHGYDLLGENIHRRIWNGDTVQIALTDGANQRGILDKVIARSGEQAPLGDGAAPVAGTTYALQTDRNCARRANLTDQID